MRFSQFVLVAMFICLKGYSQQPVKLITLDPGHFHAALVQKSMYPQVDPTVYVYAKKGSDLNAHLDKIKGYNAAAVAPTKWVEKVYEGD
ncbi:MAG: oxidoreductase, partial [Bacteroidetes bacterium]|nr:oxidoreductase [Bacteroidota bacterium]